MLHVCILVLGTFENQWQCNGKKIMKINIIHTWPVSQFHCVFEKLRTAYTDHSLCPPPEDSNGSPSIIMKMQ